MPNSVLLGFLFKPQGVKGDFNCITNFQLSEKLINTWESIFLEIEGILVPFFIERISIKSNNNLIIKLEDIDSETTAREYLKSSVFINKKDLPDAIEELDISALIGYTMLDSNHEIIGEITDIAEYPSQWMFCVNHKKQERLIPAQGEFIKKIDKETHQIIVSLPEGLLDL